MARLTHVNGSVVNVADDKVDGLLRSGFTSGGAGPAESGGYDAMTVDELKDEIRKRNEDRNDGDRLALTGSKADLVASLEADD